MTVGGIKARILSQLPPAGESEPEGPRHFATDSPILAWIQSNSSDLNNYDDKTDSRRPLQKIGPARRTVVVHSD